MPISKVVYGNNTLIDLTEDTVTTEKLGAGVTAHTKSGQRITGTAPLLYNSNSTLKICRKNVWAANTDVPLLNFGNNNIIYMRISGGNILLVSTLEGGTESTITVASPAATYVTTFRVEQVSYINRNQALIVYRYSTNASNLLSRRFIRLITRKNDGTLIQSSQINGSAAPTATVNVEAWVIPMYEAKTSFLLFYASTTISTGAVALYCSRVYANLSTGSLTMPSSSVWVTLAASDADTRMPEFFNDKYSDYGGMVFYDGANSQYEVDVWCGYSGTNKDVAATAAGDVLTGDVHILGKLTNGNLLMLSIDETNQITKLEEHEYDPITCYFTYKNSVVLNGFNLAYFYNLPSNASFRGTAIVVFNNRIHTFYSNSNSQSAYSHCIWNGNRWTRDYINVGNEGNKYFREGCAVVYGDTMHLLGGTSTQQYHMIWNGSNWSRFSDLPYPFIDGRAVVYGNRIHILGGNNFLRTHYSWNGSSWSQESNLPYDFKAGSVVVYNNRLHILGGYEGGTSKYHYSWDGSSWRSESTLPYTFYYGSAVVYENKIHIMGGVNYLRVHYSWDGSSWVSERSLPYDANYSSAVVYNNKIHLIGGGQIYKYHYEYPAENTGYWYTQNGTNRIFLLPNDILVNNEGQCYQITQPNAIAKPVVENLTVEEAYYLDDANDIGPLSDPFQGIFIS